MISCWLIQAFPLKNDREKWIFIMLTNIGGLLTLISRFPTLSLEKLLGICGFFHLSSHVVVATFVTLWLGSKLFKIQTLKTEEERISAQKLIGFDETEGIESPGFFSLRSIMTFVFIGTVAMTSQLPVIKDLGLGFVALAFAGIMLVRYKSVADRFYKAIDWDLLFFFACLFVVINVMEHALVLNLIGDWLMPILGFAGPSALLFASAAASSVTDNIPLAAMLAKILGGIPEMASNPDSPYWWAVIFGSNLGGNITPIGSASTLVSVTIIHKYGLKLSFAGFVKVALPYAVIQLALG